MGGYYERYVDESLKIELHPVPQTPS